ncbi:hypothetical protein Tco_0434405 [Tanacetum coccineum]
MNQNFHNSNSSGFDQFQPPQYSDVHQPPEEITWSESIRQKKEEEEKRIAKELAAKARYWKIPICYDDDEDYTIAITPDLPITDSLIMEDEHHDTIPTTESDELIKSSVENLVQIPSESEDLSDGECDLPLYDDSPKSHLTFSNPLFDIDDEFTSSDDESFFGEDVPMENFKIFSNPLFDLHEEIISTKVDQIDDEVLDSIDSIPPGIDSFDAESNLIESLLNQNTLIDSSSKIDSLLDEFVGELTLLKSIPPGIDDDNLDPEGKIHLVERLLYENSSPRPLEELNVENSIESFPPSPIPIGDSDSLMEKIDLFLTPDDSMPPGIENDDYDSEGDILFLEEFLSNDSPPLPENESFHYDIPSSPRPPAKPPNEGIYFEPDTGLLITKVAEQEARALQEEEEERLNLEAARELQRQLDQRHEETDIREKDKNKEKRTKPSTDWKEREKTSSTVPSDLIGPARNPLNGPD